MKLSKNLGRIATTFLATAMLASVAAVPAFADVDDLNVAEGKVTIPVNLAVDSTETTPAMSTVYTVGYLGEGDVVHEGDLKGQEGDIKGVADNSTDLTVSIAANTTPTPVSETNYGIVSDNLVLDFDTTAFRERGPGIYEYTLTETASTLPTGVDADGPFLLRVWVVNEEKDGQLTGELVVSGAELYAQTGEGQYSEDKQDSIDKEYTTYSLTLTKEIAGKFASKNTPFTFNITFQAPDGENYTGTFYTAYSGTASGDVSDVVFNNGSSESVTASLKHDGTITVTGIPSDFTYTISETDAQGYTTDIVVDDEQAGDAADTEKSVNGNMSDATTQDDKAVNVTFTNTSKNDSTVATGVMMDIAPYALLVVVAAAGCFVFLRKRRED